MSGGGRASLEKALAKWVASIDKKCLAGASADLGDTGSGLGFSSPASAADLVDALNDAPSGIGCDANAALLRAYPRAQELLDLLAPFDGGCAAADDPSSPGLARGSDAACRAQKGRCGQLAAALSADSSDDQGICVRAPAGSGSCPNDENLPGYRHVVQSVGSANPLQLVLSTFPSWSASLRAGSTRAVLVVSDDDSAPSATDFTHGLIALDADFQGFAFHTIRAPYDLSSAVCLPCSPPTCGQCDPCYGVDSQVGAACVSLVSSEGAVYSQLASQTSGVLGDICSQNFLPTFQGIANDIIAEATAP